MGPGRKLYHKPCLSCTSCRTRLDSFKLVEHNFEPYCKSCHIKNFGTVDLRHGNLPTKAVFPTVSVPKLAKRSTSPEGGLNTSFDSLDLSNDSRSQSPASPVDGQRPESPTRTMSGTYRSTSPIRANAPWKRATSPVRSFSLNSVTSSTAKNDTISPMSTGSSSNSPGRWKPPGGGGGGVICPTCQKQVYFAEQVKAIGKTWHKICLRCSECKSSLQPGRLTEKDGIVLCHNCYSKLHGPAGSGYALLGRVG